VPLEVFDSLYAVTNATGEWADSEADNGRRGPKRISLKLKMMGALYIVGQCASTQMACDLCCCGYALLSTFLHEWTAWLVETQYSMYVRLPKTVEEIRHVTSVNEKLGFPGAACSMDGVHIHWGRCHSKQRALHTGREGYPTRVYNVACDLMRRVLHVIEHSHPGACNDRTIVRFDELVIRIHRRELYSDVEFELKQKDGTTRTHKGLHALVDGGYHSWRCLICPVKVAQDSKLLHFSKRLEPTRKDVECLFGISSGAFACCAFRSSSKPRASSTTCSRRITLRRSQRDCDWISARMNDVDEGIGNGFARPPAADAAAGNEVEVSVEESRFDLHEALVEHYHQQCVSESSFWMRTAVQAHRARRAQQEQE